MMYSKTLTSGIAVEVHSSATTSPPDRKIGCAESSIWFRMAGGPSGWWRPEATKSTHSARVALDQCESAIDIALICDLWLPEISS